MKVEEPTVGTRLITIEAQEPISASWTTMPKETKVGTVEYPVSILSFRGMTCQVDFQQPIDKYRRWAMDLDTGEFILLDLQSLMEKEEVQPSWLMKLHRRSAWRELHRQGVWQDLLVIAAFISPLLLLVFGREYLVDLWRIVTHGLLR